MADLSDRADNLGKGKIVAIPTLRNKLPPLLRFCAQLKWGQWKFFETLFKQAFPPAQPDLFLADEIERLRIAPPDANGSVH